MTPVRRVHKLYFPPDGPSDSERCHSDPCPQGHRTLRGATLGPAALGWRPDRLDSQRPASCPQDT
jgi:hypothetical protein